MFVRLSSSLCHNHCCFCCCCTLFNLDDCWQRAWKPHGNQITLWLFLKVSRDRAHRKTHFYKVSFLLYTHFVHFETRPTVWPEAVCVGLKNKPEFQAPGRYLYGADGWARCETLIGNLKGDDDEMEQKTYRDGVVRIGRDGVGVKTSGISPPTPRWWCPVLQEEERAAHQHQGHPHLGKSTGPRPKAPIRGDLRQYSCWQHTWHSQKECATKF